MKKMSNKVLLLALGLAVGGYSMSYAQEAPSSGKWTLQAAIDQALKANIDVRKAQLNRSISEVDLKQSRLDLLPDVNANASHTYNYGTNVDPLTFEFRTQQVRTNNFSANASLPIFTGFQQLNRIRQNKLEMEASATDLQAMQNDVMIQVVTAYLNILFADELLKTTNEQRSVTRQQLERTQKLFKAGSVAESNVFELQSQLATDDLNYIRAQNQLDIAKLGLIQLLGMESSQNFNIEIPEIPDPEQNPVAINPEQVFDVAQQTLPQVKSADLRILSAERGIEIARGAYMPRLSFSAAIFTGYSGGRLSPMAETQAGEFSAQPIGFLNPDGTNPLIVYTPKSTRGEYPFSEQIKDNLGKQLSFSLNVPVFNGYMVRSNVERSKLAQQNAKLNALGTRNRLRQNIEQAATDAVAAQRRYSAAREQLTAQGQNFRNAELRLNNGLINTVEFNVISNNYRNAQSELIQAKYEYTFKLKVLDFYQGKDLSF